MPARHGGRFPDRIEVIWDDRVIAMEEYGSTPTEQYLKGRRPGGGTVEVHILYESYFDDHPDASGEFADPHRTR